MLRRKAKGTGRSKGDGKTRDWVLNWEEGDAYWGLSMTRRNLLSDECCTQTRACLAVS
jgi:hypothetical protein